MKKLRQTSKADAKSGFTLVELSLAMAFIALLLIAIATVATSVVAIYRKGLSVKAVNSVGRNLVDEFTRAVNLAPSVDTTSLCLGLNAYGACVSDRANKFVFQERRSIPNTNGDSEQYNGIFCTGYYSYIWNTKQGIEANDTIALEYLGTDNKIHTLPANLADTNPDKKIRLARIIDRNYRLCSATIDENYNNNNYTEGVQKVISITTLDDAKELPYPIEAPVSDFLRMFDTDLLLANLTIFPLSQDSFTLRGFMAGTFILSTLRGQPEILVSGDYCDPNGSREPDNETDGSQLSLGSEFNYCAINKFNFAARTAGSGV